MIKPKRMAKVRIVGPNSLMQRTVAILHAARTLHMEDFKGDDFFAAGNPLPGAADYSEQLVRISSLISALGIKGKPEAVSDVAAAKMRLAGVETKYLSLSKASSLAKERIAELERRKQALEPIRALGIKQDVLSGYSSIVQFVGTARADFRPALDKLTKDYELIEAPHGKRIVFALFVKPSFKEQAAAILSKHGYAQISLPENLSEGTEAEIAKARAELSSAELSLEELKKNSAGFLLGYEAALTSENEKAEAPLRFAASKTAFVVHGWVPAAVLPKLKSTLESGLHSKVCVDVLDEKKGAPVALENPKALKPFEFFMDLYSLPRYAELDPTFLVFLTFPLFFGFMLGDVGYGLATLLISLVLRSKTKGQLRALFNITILASLATIAFGFVFGEFFGMEFIEHPLLNRAHDITTMLLITIFTGCIHVTLGFILGFYNVLVAHGLKHAILEKGSWLLLEAGAALLIADYLGFASIGMIPGAALIAVSICLLLKGEGIMGLIELPGLLSNILSYARLFAIGLASVELAVIINEFAGSFIKMGGIYIAGAIALLFAGHFLNLMIGLLGAFLHSLRLHYVEFFTKFFEGGGVRYAPFGTQNKEV